MKPLPTPILDLWRQELATGKRTPTTLDALWRAACAEAAAGEAEAGGYALTASRSRSEAAAILTAAVQGGAA